MLNWKDVKHVFQTVPQRLFFGLKDPEIKQYVREGLDFVYVDNPYFGRGGRAAFRMIRRGLHLTELLDRPKDRLKRRWEPRCDRWRRKGHNVVVIPPSLYHIEIYDAQEWLPETVATLLRSTQRRVRVKTDKTIPLEKYLEDAWAVVTFGSVAGVEAAQMGIPVFAGPICPTRPISAGRIENVDDPFYSDIRDQWLASLSYATWRLDETSKINFKDYNYP